MKQKGSASMCRSKSATLTRVFTVCLVLAALQTLSSGGMPGAYAAAPPIDVFVGYADDLRASPFFPVPWASDANVLFIGSGSPFDAGAVRLDNRSGAPLTIDDVTVTLGGGAVSHSLWGTFKIPAGFSAILTQTTQFNFDTSDEFVFRICGDPAPSGTEPFPRIFVTIGGVTTEFDDTAHVLDTGGFDFVCIGNESLQWRPIGTCGIDCQPLDCSGAVPSLSELWPPNHEFVPISILGVTDPDGDPVSITITGITQDEPVNGLGDGNTSPDGRGVGTDTASVRAERTGTPRVPGNGRVYVISFTASDGLGGECQGSVGVCVPHDQRPGHVCIDDGQIYDSTQP